MNVIDSFKLNPDAITYFGADLSRPECIIAEQDGTLWIADNRGAFSRHAPGQAAKLIGPREGLPNGIAMTKDGDFYVADMGKRHVYRIDREGRKEIVLDSFEGNPLGAVNFVYLDERDRLWVTVSTDTDPHLNAFNHPIPDGYVLLIDENGVRRVADGLLFTNEVRADPEGKCLYVAETTAGHITRYTINADSSLSNRQVFGPSPLFSGARVDGISFDAQGNLWVTEITRNALVVIKPDGNAVTIFEDPEGKAINFPTSVTFGGPDLHTVYIGSLKMNRIASFRSPIPGAPMRHWHKKAR